MGQHSVVAWGSTLQWHRVLLPAGFRLMLELGLGLGSVGYVARCVWHSTACVAQRVWHNVCARVWQAGDTKQGMG